jgi:Icc-related predicted phosphoesterase
MKILAFSDIHGDIAALERLMEREADHYIAAGDLASWGRGLDRCGEILARRAGRVRVLPGNHESEGQIAEFCRRFGLKEFHGRSFQQDGWWVAGLGYSSPTPFHTPGEYSEDELAQRLQPFAELDPLILVCHAPPLDTPLDQIRKGAHGGSRAVREFIERRQPAWFVCGHIHEAEGVEATLGKTRGFNAGRRGVLIESGKIDL